jgi:hypothetical protein
METVFCPKCGKEQLGRANRCWNCSTSLEQIWNVLSAELVEPEESSLRSQVASNGTSDGDSGGGNAVLPNVTAENDRESDLIQAQISDPSSSDSPLTRNDLNSDKVEILDAEVYFVESTDDNDLRTNTGNSGSRAQSNGMGAGEGQAAAASVARIGSPFEQGQAVNLTRPQPAKSQKAAGQWQTELENFSARGGAVAAIGLGVYSVIGGWFTPLALINSFLGLVLGMWGLSSKKKRWATIGMAICLLGIGVSIGRIGWKAIYQPGGYFYSLPGADANKEEEEEF